MSMRSSNRLRCASEKRSIGLLCTHLHTYMSIIDLQLFCIVLPSLAATGTSSVSKENLARNCNTKCGLSALSTNICSWCYYVICTNSSSQRQWFSALGEQKQKSAPRSFYFFSAGGTGPESKRYSMNYGNWCLNKLATKMPRVYWDGLLSAHSANLVVRDSRLYSLVEKKSFWRGCYVSPCLLRRKRGTGGRGNCRSSTTVSSVHPLFHTQPSKTASAAAAAHWHRALLRVVDVTDTRQVALLLLLLLCLCCHGKELPHCCSWRTPRRESNFHVTRCPRLALSRPRG